MKTRILIMAGGTATAWHMVNIIKNYFDKQYEIHICDINDANLVPASKFAFKFHKVPRIDSENYKETIYNLLKKEKINIMIPLIDNDLEIFSFDNKKLLELGVVSTAPLLSTFYKLTNKRNMFEFLSSIGIMTPTIYDKTEIKDDEEYIIKPELGFGSRGFKILKGSEIRNLDTNGFIIQEKYISEEVTAEIYNAEKLHVFIRERIETKSGVCTKMKPIKSKEIEDIIKKLVSSIECPKAFCIQFMKNKNGNWGITDCNLRIGAGTALSTKIGFQLTRAFFNHLLGNEYDPSLFKIDKKIKTVVRVYDEVAF